MEPKKRSPDFHPNGDHNFIWFNGRMVFILLAGEEEKMERKNICLNDEEAELFYNLADFYLEQKEKEENEK